MHLGKLEPEKVKQNIILSSLYITAYDLLEVEIKENTKTFSTFHLKYSNEPDWKEKAKQEYKREVTNKYPFKDKLNKVYKDDYRACSLWLKDIGAINLKEVKTLLKIRTHRNDVVHNLPSFIGDNDKHLNISLFNELQEIYKKIRIFWIRTNSLDLNPEFDNVVIKDKDIEATLFWDYIKHCIEVKI
ncbi:hypothetical protein TH61_00405 [Rufibacter sp. DG15C]|uniref:hypothetical protein n=1 Tax=Rufibacter sp. DG15C TaxID=1379909 RepID=UPI00078B4865|nr:hypothetical protein [Rufibacter sp. DG15C]AMM49942.1 hypothetical protein TH61_00405 [Rufibacter sp. DG15C]